MVRVARQHPPRLRRTEPTHSQSLKSPSATVVVRRLSSIFSRATAWLWRSRKLRPRCVAMTRSGPAGVWMSLQIARRGSRSGYDRSWISVLAIGQRLISAWPYSPSAVVTVLAPMP